jgi:hypothetical protein
MDATLRSAAAATIDAAFGRSLGSMLEGAYDRDFSAEDWCSGPRGRLRWTCSARGSPIGATATPGELRRHATRSVEEAMQRPIPDATLVARTGFGHAEIRQMTTRPPER